VDIAIAKEKERLQKEKQLEREKLERDKLEQEKLKADKLNKDKNKDKAAQALEAKKLEETRRKNIERMTALAGSGPEGSSGSAAQSKGPSAGYAGRINQLIKLNTKYSSTDVVNPSVKVLLRVEASGAIYESTVISSSGNAAWNDAVVRAIDRMGLIPKDIDGKIPNEIVKSGLELTVTR
jgi:colicin import membrane protein